MISVFSENPENDLWRELLQFSYEANINRYLSKKGLHANGETINCIVGSFLQADEYYRAAKDANLQISPLLLYYGTTNLLYGMVNLLEKFLYFARRLIPNYVLNRIMGDKVQYTSGRYSEIDTVKLVGEHQVQEMVERQIRNQFEKQKIMLNSSK